MSTRKVAPGLASICALAALSLAWGCNDSPTEVVTHEPAAVTIRVSFDHIHTGLTGTLVADVTCHHGDLLSVPVIWSVDDPAVASVDSRGEVTGLTVGEVEVSATAGEVSTGVTVTVAASVVAIELAPADATLYMTESVEFSPTLFDEGGETLDRVVSWTSSSPVVASVDAQGVVTARTVGTVLITAESEGVTESAGVTVLAPVAQLLVEPEELTLYVRERAELRVRVRDQNGTEVTRTVAWSSSDESVVTVDSDGTVEAVSGGAAVITAESEGVTAEVEVTVIMPVASVQLSPTEATLIAGAMLQLETDLFDEEGEQLDRPVTYTSNASGVAAVSHDGLVMAVATGLATINAESEGVVAHATIVVLPPLAALRVSPAEAIRRPGETVQLDATLTDASGAVLERPVTWATADEAVATVDEDGLVTAVAVGEVEVTATAEGRSDAALIEVIPHVNRVDVAPTAAMLSIGETVSLSAKAFDADGHLLGDREVEWRSADIDVATVDADGLVTAVAPGVAAVYASSEGVSAEATITVKVPVDHVAVSDPGPDPLMVGATLQLEAVAYDAADNPLNRPIEWSSDDDGVATVDDAGLVTAEGPGLVAITAESEGVGGSVAIEVLAPVAAVHLTPDEATRKPGETVQLQATAVDQHGGTLDRPVSWASADEDVATVDQSGLVEAVDVGEVTITATAEGHSGAAVLTVIPWVDRVEVAPDEAALSIGETLGLSAVALDAHGNVLGDRDIEWSSGDPGIASVSGGGVVSALAVGVVTIFASSEGVSGEAAITVRVPVDHVIVTDPGGEPVEIGLTLQLEATVYDAYGNILDRPVAWSSNLPDVASVDETGLVTGEGRGTAMITATAEGKSASVEVRVVGESTEAGNNLSYPVVFAEGIGLSGLPVSDALGDPVYANTGVRPAGAEGITVDSLPFFYGGNAPDYGAYYEQQGVNVWQADWADGTLLGSRSAEASWGDNLTHQTWDTHSMIRLEVVLSDLGIGTLDGYNMAYLYGTGPDEMQGTDGSIGAFVPTIYAITPRLIIAKLDDDTGEVLEEVFNGAIWEGSAEDGPGAFSAEVNVGGKIVYGFNFFIRDIVLESAAHKYGWWRLTFALDAQGTVGTETIMRNLSIDVVTGEGDPELTYPPVRAADGLSTSLDIYVDKGSGQ